MRTTDPQISFADLEFINQGIQLNATLQAISDFIEEHLQLVALVGRDLERGLKQPGTGRSGLTPQQVIRSLILRRVKNWDYRELRERTADGYTLRRFTHFNASRVPQHDAFNRAFNRLLPATLEAINQAVVEAAVTFGIEDATKLRVDTTVVETDIHHPTDSTLLWDTVRVITRLVKRLARVLPVEGFKNHKRLARRRMQQIHYMNAKERQEKQLSQYRQLIEVTESVVQNARRVLAQTSPETGIVIDRLRAQIQHYCALGDRVVDQSRRRVLLKEQVPNEEKIFSIFETHTDLIKRGKPRKPVEFGHKIFLAESALGLITQYRVLNGNPSDQLHVASSLDQHKKMFGRAPQLYSSDRGFYSEENIRRCEDSGVILVCIPQSGGKKTLERTTKEKSPAFKKGQRFRAGIEGRISVLFRGRGMKRSLVEGSQRFELFVGAAVSRKQLDGHRPTPHQEKEETSTTTSPGCIVVFSLAFSPVRLFNPGSGEPSLRLFTVRQDPLPQRIFLPRLQLSTVTIASRHYQTPVNTPV
jgi:transposase, IS5 family